MKMQKKLVIHRLKALVIALNCLVAALSFINLYTITAGAIQVEVPEEEDFTWRFDPEASEVQFLSNFSIANKGFYGIHDLDIRAVLKDVSGKEMINYSNLGLDIPAGRERTFDVLASLPLDNVDIDQIMDMILYDSVFYLDLDIDAEFMWGLGTFEVDEVVVYPWEAPIKDFWNWLGNLTLEDIAGYLEEWMNGGFEVPEIEMLDGLDVDWDLDLALTEGVPVRGFVEAGLEDMFAAGITFQYSYADGWSYETYEEVY